MTFSEQMNTVKQSVLGIKKEDTPNILTIGRIVVIPIILVLMAIPTTFTAWSALFFYTLACVTDWFDGYLARKWGTTSDIGKFLDPIADKLLVTALILMLAALDRLDGIWFIPAVVILSREIFISGLREYLGPKNIVVPVTNLAKWKTTAQMICLGFLIMGEHAPESIPSIEIGWGLISISAVLTAITGWQYFRVALPVLTENKNNSSSFDVNKIADADIIDG